MKTKEQLEERVKSLKETIYDNDARWQSYGNIESCINDWKGKKAEMQIAESYQEELDFLEKILRFVF